jgi:hypothetical protein
MALWPKWLSPNLRLLDTVEFRYPQASRPIRGREKSKRRIRLSFVPASPRTNFISKRAWEISKIGWYLGLDRYLEGTRLVLKRYLGGTVVHRDYSKSLRFDSRTNLF